MQILNLYVYLELRNILHFKDNVSIIIAGETAVNSLTNFIFAIPLGISLIKQIV